MKNTGIKFILALSFVFATIFSYGAVIQPLSGASKQEGNQIEWSVDTQSDIDFFILQRSVDGIHFMPIATIQTSNITLEYSFLDKHAANKNWFYRVIKVNKNGVGDFSSALYLD